MHGRISAVATILFVFIGLAQINAENITAEGITCKVLGQSGKIMITRSSSVNESSTDTIMMTMDYIKELGANAAEVGTTGKLKHVYNNFAKTDFTFSPPKDVKFQNLSVKTFDFTAFLDGPNATLKVDVYIFKEAGVINVGGNQTANVSKGTFKFSIEISGWQFCESAADNCKKGQTKEVGAFVEFGIEFKTKQKPTKQAKSPKCKDECMDEFSLGGGEIMSVPKQALDNDINVVNMPSGFPEVEEKGSGKSLMKFRFPKFTNKISFDPLISESSDAVSPTVVTTSAPSTPTPTAGACGVTVELGVLLLSFLAGIYIN